VGDGFVRNNTNSLDEIRWQVVKAMLENFPKLRQRVKEYLEVKSTNLEHLWTCLTENNARITL
jgi:hypothetical protein